MGGINLGGLASGFESGMGSMESLRQKAMQIKQAQFDLDQQKQKVAAEAQRFAPQVGAGMGGMPGAQQVPPGAQGAPPAGPGGVQPFQPPPMGAQPGPPPGPGGVSPMGGQPPQAPPQPQGPPPGAAPPQGMGGVNVMGNMAAAGVQPQGAPQGQGGMPDPMQDAIAAQQKAITFINQNYPNASPQQKSFLFQDLMQSMKTQDPLLRAQIAGDYSLRRAQMVGDYKAADLAETEQGKDRRSATAADLKKQAMTLKEKLDKYNQAAATNRTAMTQAGANSRTAAQIVAHKDIEEYKGNLKAVLLDAGIDEKVADRAAADQTRIITAGANAVNPDALKGVSAPAPQRGPRITPPKMGGGTGTPAKKVKVPPGAPTAGGGKIYFADGAWRDIHTGQPVK